jgi:hypothetical protein
METMKKEYDFSKAERGKFYRKNAGVRLPIYLDTRLQKQVEGLATRTGWDMGELVNHIVETEMRLIGDLEPQKET